jgi:hypothetical protein
MVSSDHINTCARCSHGHGNPTASDPQLGKSIVFHSFCSRQVALVDTWYSSVERKWMFWDLLSIGVLVVFGFLHDPRRNFLLSSSHRAIVLELLGCSLAVCGRSKYMMWPKLSGEPVPTSSGPKMAPCHCIVSCL